MLLSVISLDRYTNFIEDRLVLQKEQIVSHEIVEDFVRYHNQQSDEDAIRANIDYINNYIKKLFLILFKVYGYERLFSL